VSASKGPITMPTEIAEGGQATLLAMQRMRDASLPKDERFPVHNVQLVGFREGRVGPMGIGRRDRYPAAARPGLAA